MITQEYHEESLSKRWFLLSSESQPSAQKLLNRPHLESHGKTFVTWFFVIKKIKGYELQKMHKIYMKKKGISNNSIMYCYTV